MTDYITAIVIGVCQIILSINLIIRKKNRWAIASEIISSLMLLYISNGCSVEVQNVLCVGIALAEYLCVKIFLVIFMIIARYYSFYRVRALCKKKKKVGSKKFRFIRAINKVDYWPRLKLGLPGLANRTNPETNVKFDSKGFPEFQVYYTVRLQRKHFRETRQRHFYMANKILARNFLEVSKLKLSKKQRNELKEGKTPKGYTWHHHQDAGKLQLVDEEIHAKTYHYGGYSIWGGK